MRGSRDRWSNLLFFIRASSSAFEQFGGGERGYQMVNEFNLFGFNTYFTFRLENLQDHILVNAYGEVEEDPEFIKIDGVFFVKHSVEEGDL